MQLSYGLMPTSTPHHIKTHNSLSVHLVQWKWTCRDAGGSSRPLHWSDVETVAEGETYNQERALPKPISYRIQSEGLTKSSHLQSEGLTKLPHLHYTHNGLTRVPDPSALWKSLPQSEGLTKILKHQSKHTIISPPLPVFSWGDDTPSNDRALPNPRQSYPNWPTEKTKNKLPSLQELPYHNSNRLKRKKLCLFVCCR